MGVKWLIALLAVSSVHALTTQLWYPYAEWSFENPTYSGNPFDIEAVAHFSDGKSPGLFYDGGTTWKLRYMCTETGTFTFTTTSTDPDLNGKTGSVTCTGNENGMGLLIPAGKDNKKWYVAGWGRAIVPAWAMFPGNSRDGWPTQADTDQWIQSHIKDAGFIGAHHSGPANAWYDWGCDGTRVGCNTENPDPAAFEHFEQLMHRFYQEGAFLHIWLFWDCQRDMCDANHDRGLQQERFRRYLADRWGAIPNWMIGEGFDNFEDDSTAFANKYYSDINDRLQWHHFIGMRSYKNSFRIICTDCNYYSWESQEEAGPMTFERWKASYDNVPDRPAFEEDRYRYRVGNVKGPKSPDDQRRYMWRQAMSGGVGAIYGYLEGSGGSFSRLDGYPDSWESQIIIWHDFWYNDKQRFHKSLERCSFSEGEDVCGDGMAIAYKEDTDSISFSSAEGSVQAMDTKTGQYIELGEASDGFVFDAPHVSDWVVVFSFNHSTPVLERTDNRFLLDGQPISYFGLRAANAMQNDAITDAFIRHLDTMKAHGIQSFSVTVQGGRHTEGGNSAFNGYNSDGSLKPEYFGRLASILDAAAERDMVAAVVFFYRGKDQELTDENAVISAVENTVEWLKPWRNLWLNIINEPGHSGYDHSILKTSSGWQQIYEIAKSRDPERIVYVAHTAGANDGFRSDTWGRNGIGTSMNSGDVSIEWISTDSFSAPGVFTAAQIENAQAGAQQAFGKGAYWFWHSAWHQKADAADWPNFGKGGAGTHSSRGVSFIWNQMQSLNNASGPTRSNPAPSGLLQYGTASAVLSLSTEMPATCRYSTAAGAAYSSMTDTFASTGTTSHSQEITGLEDGAAYTYYVRCIDNSGNANTDDFIISFSVASAAACSPADASGDGVVSMAELIVHIGKWKTGAVQMPELMAAIREWKEGCIE